MAPKKKNQPAKVQTNAGVNPMGAPAKQEKPTVREAIRSAGSGGITKQEIQQIQKDTGTSMQKIIQQLDIVNKNLKEAEKQTIALNSGAANMLIKDAGKATTFNQPNFGTGNIGRALAGAIGTPGSTYYINPQSGAPSGSKAAVPGTGFIPGGMQIRGGGRLAVRPQTMAAPTVTTDATTTTTTPGLTEEEIQKRIDEGITAGINDYMSGVESAYNQDDQDYLNMLNNLPNMFAQQMQGMFDPLQQAISSLQTQEPMRLYGAGQNYNVGGIRTNPRRPQGRSGFLRGNMGIGSSAGTGLTSGLSGLAGALGSLGGLTI
jgi:hypothetical protein